MIKLTKYGRNGLGLTGYDIGLDCSGRQAKHNFISHAHSDHVPRNGNVEVFATEATGALMSARGFNGGIIPLPFYEKVRLPQADVSLFPAGHILGSAMVLVECEEGNLLYTGDCRTPPAPTTEGFALPDKVDYLITEATFGLPVYRWPDHESLFVRMRDFAAETLNDGEVPAFLCYNLGKAQEVMHAMAPLGQIVYVHPACYPLCKVYEARGIDLGRYESWNEGQSFRECIVIAPGISQDTGILQHIPRKKIAYCSGWAAREACRVQMNVDELFPLSDHLDFFELLEMCRQLKPKHVFITHTPDSSVVQHYLGEMGVCSEAI